MNKKRGVLFVVLVMFLVLFSFVVVGEVDFIQNSLSPASHDYTYLGLLMVDEDQDGEINQFYLEDIGYGDGCNGKISAGGGYFVPTCKDKGKYLSYSASDSDHQYIVWLFETKSKGTHIDVELDDGGGEGPECSWDLTLDENGCWIVAMEYDGGGDSEDCTAVKIIEEFPIIDQKLEQLTIPDEDLDLNILLAGDCLEKGYDDTCQALENILQMDQFQTSPEHSLICADRNFKGDKETKHTEDFIAKVWFQCDASNKDMIITRNLIPEQNEDEDEEVNYLPDLKEVYQCRNEGGSFKWINMPKEELGLDPDDNKFLCEGAWNEDLPEGERCCGDDEEDYGKVSTDKRFICTNSKTYTPETESEEGEWGDGTWSWEDAAVGGFKIVTIMDEDSGTLTDYASIPDGSDWQECNNEQLILSGSIGAERFKCTKLGDDWVYGVCGAGGFGEKPGVTSDVALGGERGRSEGEGLFSLVGMGTENTGLGAQYYILDFNPRKLDLSGGYLEFIVFFEDIAEGLSEDGSDLSKLGLQLMVRGEGTSISYDIFDHALNTPLLKKGAKIHIKIPTDSGWNKIERLEFNSGINKKVLSIHNLFFHKTSSPVYCSSESSYWIDNLDDYKTTCETGKDAEGKGGFYTWIEEKDANGFCCGDDGEYELLGEELCWNGEFVEEEKEITEITLSLNGNEKSYSCTENNSEDCKFAGLEVPYTVSNLHPEIYDLVFATTLSNLPGIEGKYAIKKKIGKDPVTIGMKGWLELENAKPTVYFDGEELFGCQGNGVYDGLNVAEQGLCGVYEPEDETEPGLFCSERGWSNKASVGEEKIISSGELIPGEEVIVQPKNRTTETKVMFGKNLVYNPSFDGEFWEEWQ
jgi:hypothetical protein